MRGNFLVLLLVPFHAGFHRTSKSLSTSPPHRTGAYLSVLGCSDCAVGKVCVVENDRTRGFTFQQTCQHGFPHRCENFPVSFVNAASAPKLILAKSSLLRRIMLPAGRTQPAVSPTWISWRAEVPGKHHRHPPDPTYATPATKQLRLCWVLSFCAGTVRRREGGFHRRRGGRFHSTDIVDDRPFSSRT